MDARVDVDAVLRVPASLRASERLALALATRIVTVNSSIAAHVARLSSRAAKKTEVMSVSVDTRRFRPGPFDLQDGVFRICFARRLDEFKDPPLMFDVLARLHAKSIAGSSSTMSARPIPRGIRNLPKPSHSQSVTARKVLTACAPSWRDAMPAFSPRISKACLVTCWKRWRAAALSARSNCRNTRR
jgi:hypothetical protein